MAASHLRAAPQSRCLVLMVFKVLSVSWQVSIHFDLGDCCRLIPNFFLSLALILVLSQTTLNSSSTPRRHSQVIFQVVDSVCWEHNRARTFSWLKASFRLWIPVSRSSFWSNSSSKTPQRRTSWTAQQCGAEEELPYNRVQSGPWTHIFTSHGQPIPGAHGVFH